MREDSFSDKESKEISILAQIRHKKKGVVSTDTVHPTDKRFSLAIL